MRNYRRHRQERREQIAFVCSLLLAVGLVLLAIAPAPVHSAEPGEYVILETPEPQFRAAETSVLMPPAKTPMLLPPRYPLPPLSLQLQSLSSSLTR